VVPGRAELKTLKRHLQALSPELLPIKIKDDSASRVRLDGPYCVVSRDACGVVFTTIHFCE
jgi:hypothetical protein